MIGSVGLTAPAAFWLFQQGPDTHHEPHGGPLKHDFAHGDSEDEQAPEPVGEDKDEGGDDAKSDDSSSDDEGGKETPDTSDDEADDKGGEKKGDKSDEEGKVGGIDSWLLASIASLHPSFMHQFS